MSSAILCGDALDVLRGLPDNSLDAMVTDPPAGISFMGKSWDHDKGGRDAWVAWLAEIMREALRVVKPGGHALVWALPRTSHWTAMALEDAGFEIRDVVTHIFGSGFPKSLDVSKAIDKVAGAERAVLAKGRSGKTAIWSAEGGMGDFDITTPATVAPQQWQGWGTALKPASEHWILCRKPLGEPTVAANVLRWGTGAINVDGCRIGSEPPWLTAATPRKGTFNASFSGEYQGQEVNGRWPANLVLDEAAAALLDAQSGITTSHHITRRWGKDRSDGWGMTDGGPIPGYTDRGGVSRFFYVAKASRAERDAGLDDLPLHTSAELTGRKEGSAGLQNPRASSRGSARHNTHPTVKPIALMRWLVRLITPPGGTLLDCFAGSGTTAVACEYERVGYVAIEREAEYVDIIEARTAYARIEAAKAPEKPIRRPKPRRTAQAAQDDATVEPVSLWALEEAV